LLSRRLCSSGLCVATLIPIIFRHRPLPVARGGEQVLLRLIPVEQEWRDQEIQSASFRFRFCRFTLPSGNSDFLKGCCVPVFGRFVFPDHRHIGHRMSLWFRRTLWLRRVKFPNYSATTLGIGISVFLTCLVIEVKRKRLLSSPIC